MALPTVVELERVLVDAIDRDPDTELIDTEDWVQVRTPSSPRGNQNMVLKARLDPDAVDDRIAAVNEDHAERGAMFRWVVAPSSAPGDLASRLEAAGLEHLGHTFGMALAVPDEIPRPDIDGFSVRRVGPNDVDALADVTTLAWQRGAAFRETVVYLSRKQGPQLPIWIASVHDEPIASANLRILRRVGYLQGCAVLPAFRRRGVYRALVYHRLAHLRDLGIPVAVVWADANTSAVACGKVGFEKICEADWYQSPERST